MARRAESAGVAVWQRQRARIDHTALEFGEPHHALIGDRRGRDAIREFAVAVRNPRDSAFARGDKRHHPQRLFRPAAGVQIEPRFQLQIADADILEQQGVYTSACAGNAPLAANGVERAGLTGASAWKCSGCSTVKLLLARPFINVYANGTRSVSLRITMAPPSRVSSSGVVRAPLPRMLPPAFRTASGPSMEKSMV